MKNLFIYISILFLFACASTISTSNANKLALGMTKAEVIKVVGQPSRIGANSGQEILEYDVRGSRYKGCATFMSITTLGAGVGGCTNATEKLQIILVDGKVNSYQTFE